MAAQAVKPVTGIRVLKWISEIHWVLFTVPDLAPEPAIAGGGGGIFDHEGPVIGAAELVRRNLGIARGRGRRELFFDDDSAVGNFTFAPVEQPVGDLRRIEDAHGRMHNGGRSAHERPGIADPLVLTPAELAIVE